MRILWVAGVIILIDQITKLWVRTTMYMGESIPLVGSWLRLTFTENPGMAFGLQLGSTYVVTFFSVLATALIIAYLWQVRKGPLVYRLSIVVVLGGAIGNIIDRIFYGKLFAYGNYFNGHVVDFIHVDVWRGVVANWIPFLGGEAMALFPIWNVADMAIVLGVGGMLFAQQKLARSMEERRAAEQAAQSSAASPLSVNGAAANGASADPADTTTQSGISSSEPPKPSSP